MAAEMSSTHYKLVWDGEQVRRFAEVVLKDMSGDQVRLVMLLARRKYMTIEERELGRAGGKNENMHLPRKVVRHIDGARFLQTLRSYEVPVGTYTFPMGKLDGVETEPRPIPQTSLALYITLQPRSAVRAWIKLQEELSDSLRAVLDDSTIAEETKAKFSRMDSIFKGELHRNKSPSGVEYVDLDVDTKDADNIFRLKDALINLNIRQHIKFAVETRGGYHVVFDKKDVQQQLSDLHKFGRSTVGPDKKHWMSVHCDGMIPIPGTIQGGFQVHFVDF